MATLASLHGKNAGGRVRPEAAASRALRQAASCVAGVLVARIRPPMPSQAPMIGLTAIPISGTGNAPTAAAKPATRSRPPASAPRPARSRGNLLPARASGQASATAATPRQATTGEMRAARRTMPSPARPDQVGRVGARSRSRRTTDTSAGKTRSVAGRVEVSSMTKPAGGGRRRSVTHLAGAPSTSRLRPERTVAAEMSGRALRKLTRREAGRVRRRSCARGRSRTTGGRPKIPQRRG